MPHLWEVDHAYYCSKGDVHAEYESWNAFLRKNGEMDEDYNLIFRWDWKRSLFPDTDPDELCLFFVQQRIGRITSCTIRVTDADERSVIVWLQPRFGHLIALWKPLGII